MTQSDPLRFRPATKADAEAIARLTDIAGEGMPSYFWRQAAQAGETPLAVGTRRAARDEGNFSYRNAVMAEMEGAVAGMLLGYKQPDPYDTSDLAGLSELVRPLVELESLAPGSWYVNVLTMFDGYRGRGIGSRLLATADTLAADTRARGLSLIVAGENARAHALYERHGYRTLARRPFVGFAGAPHAGDWVLMIKER